MKRLQNGDVLYGDDFWFNSTLLMVLLLGSPGVAWVEFTKQPPDYLLGTLSVIGSIAAVSGVFVLQRRTYRFSPSTSMMTWSSRGLLVRTGGQVGFQDIAVTIDAGRFMSNFARTSRLGQIGLGIPLVYDVMLTTPMWRAYLGSSQNDWGTAVKQASDLRMLLGQNPDSLVGDSIAQMLKDGNRLGARSLQHESRATVVPEL